MVEKDPHGKDQHEPGAKLDAGKIRMDLLQHFCMSLEGVAALAEFGANKYSEGGFLEVPEGEQRYSRAMLSHYFKENIEYLDGDSELPHMYAVAWNALARLELHLRKKHGVFPFHNKHDDVVDAAAFTVKAGQWDLGALKAQNPGRIEPLEINKIVEKGNISKEATQSEKTEWLSEAATAIKICFSSAEPAKSLRDAVANWMSTAAQCQRNADYYRKLVEQCGAAIGKQAFTADDGTVAEDVLCAKVPELVEGLANSLLNTGEVK